MTGDEHYREAELYLRSASEAAAPGAEVYFAAVAQVHATLALAAATAGNIVAAYGEATVQS